MQATHKTCSKCGECKLLDGFHKKHGKPVGICKPCACAKTRAWAAANAEKKRAADKKYHLENPPTKEQVRASYLRNRASKLAYEKRYRTENPEKRKAILKKSEERNPETKKRNRIKQSELKKENPEISRAVLRRQVDSLSDGYVKSLLTSHKEKRNGGQIPPELIALKREQLTLYRLARQIRQSIEKEEK